MGGSNSKLSDTRKAEIYRRVSFLKARAQFTKLIDNSNNVEKLRSAMVGYPVSRNFGVYLKHTFRDDDEKSADPLTLSLILKHKVLQEFDGKDENYYFDISLFDLLSLPLSQKSAQSINCAGQFFLGLTETQFEFLFPSPFAKALNTEH